MTKLELLQKNGNVILFQKDNLMSPLICNKQKYKLEISDWDSCNINDIIYCKLYNKILTCLVYDKCDYKGILIGNNKGFMKGWTKSVYAKVTKIF